MFFIRTKCIRLKPDAALNTSYAYLWYYRNFCNHCREERKLRYKDMRIIILNSAEFYFTFAVDSRIARYWSNEHNMYKKA